MASIGGERLLSNYVDVLLEMAVSAEFMDIFHRTKLDVSLLQNLETALLKVKAMINDAEEKHITQLTVNYWQDRVREAVSEVDYLFDQINTEVLRCKVEVGSTPNPTSKVRNIFSSSFNQFHRIINSKMQKLYKELEWLISRAPAQLGVRNSNTVWHEIPTSSVMVDESSIYGRDSDIKKLKHLLLSTDSKIRIISIVGMGGVGKTTLAKLLYNDPEVDNKFELKLWVYISKNFDIFRVLETILESITSQRISNDYVNAQHLEYFNTIRNGTSDNKSTIYWDLLLVTLQQILSTTIFFLVLDDVWDANPVNWIYLMNIFNDVETGSRIIVTTRDDRVVLSMQSILSIHYLRPLESEDCWSLFAKHAFGVCNYQQQQSNLEEIGREIAKKHAFGVCNYQQQQSNLEEIGREIAKKCDGLPLAALSLGSLLCNNWSSESWKWVLESNICESRNHDVDAALQLSYHYLSTPLKRCFAYCSIFPKKSILEKKMVVQLWIAEGLVETPTYHESLEEVGEEYFNILVSTSLIQRRSIGDEEVNFEMHNLIHDLATMISSPHCILLNERNLFAAAHNLSYNRGLYDSFNKFDRLVILKDLRSFLALPLQEQSPICLLSNKVLHDLLPTMKKLRVLSLSNYKSITEIPNSIGNLLYMRYLNLSHTKIERLPSETCKLYNLQFLLLSGCKRLTELPEDMGKLVNLRHLDVSDTALREMPVQISKLENLQTLSDFVVSKHTGGLKVGELGKYPHLQGKLSISKLQNVNDPFEAVQANMKMKERIDELSLEWECGSTSSNSQIPSVFEHLRPSTNLKKLTIKGYGGINFPNWLGDSLFINMVYIRISNCDKCLWIPPLGQLGNLKELIIEGMQSIQTIGTEFYGSDVSPSFQPFPSLETLHFENMQEWEEWNLIEGTTKDFPCLRTLSLSMCPKLRLGNKLDEFPSLTEPELRERHLLVQSIPSLDNLSRQIIMFPLNSLRQLIIDGFPSPMSLPRDGLPRTLKSLIINNCENLEFLPHEYLHNYTSLEELKISYSCNSMTSFTLGALPVLKSLFIEGCKNLKSILIAEDVPEKSLSFLKSLKIWDCNELDSFPPGGLPTPNLVYLAVWKCEKLSSLPEAMNTLTGLQEMEIDNLPNLQSFVMADLPISLRELTVGSVGGIMWNTDPTWEHLTCLSVLRINGNVMVNKLMGPLLPESLVTLCICGLDVKRIDGKWFQQLTSLRNLEIVNAPKLNSLPKKGLPSRLSVLNMTRCPLLKAKMQRKRGKEWRKIAHIPSIIIDDELIT